MNSSHTPAPWKFDGRDIIANVDAEKELGVDLVFKTDGYTVPYKVAQSVSAKNAHLIEAAPDLLDALVKLANIVNELDFAGFDTKGEDPATWTEQAWAVIAKATGR